MSLPGPTRARSCPEAARGTHERGGCQRRSGAPVVNARGEVVGLNVAGGLVEGRMVGHAHPVESVSAHLQRGLEAAK